MRNTKKARFVRGDLQNEAGPAPEGLISKLADNGQRFHAVAASFQVSPDQKTLFTSAEVAESLDLHPDDVVAYLPFT